MTFQIHIQGNAVVDLESIHEYLSAYSQDAAERTYASVKQAILGLAEFPRRYAVAPESARASVEIRHLIVGNYRILYSIIGETVTVRRVVHAAKDLMDPMELT